MSSRRQYLLNIFWSWMGAATLILNGAIMARYLIRSLGIQDYGIWSLGLSLVEYFWLIDLGVRPATVKLTAEYHALQKWTHVNQLLSTAAVYSGLMGLIVLGLISLNTSRIASFFHIANPSFPLLLHVVSLSWAFGLIFNVFGAGLEGFQRFDITNHIFISFTFLRSVALLVVVYLGYGIFGMSLALLGTQFLMYAAFYVCLRRVFPPLHISPLLATRNAGLEIWLYARQVVGAMVSGRIISSAMPTLITRLLGVRNVTFYSTTLKTLDYAAEGIGRIGLITSPRATNWMALGMRPQILRLGEYGNKYCLTLWLVFATFLGAYGGPLFRLWINEEFSNNATILLKIVIVGYTLWLGQFVSASILMGIARYSEYSMGLLIEALSTVVLGGFLFWRYGLVAGVAAYSIMIILNRFLNLSRIYTKEFQIPWLPFVWRIYRVPAILAVCDVVGLYAIRYRWIPGSSWFQLLGVGALNTVVFGIAAFWLVLEPEHRELLIGKVMERFQAYVQPRTS